MKGNYNDKRIYKVKLDYEFFKTHNLGAKIRDTLMEIEENQSFLIVYTISKDMNEFNDPLGYYLYNTRIIISPLAIKQKKEITKSLVELIRNSKFDEEINIKENDKDITIMDNDGVVVLEESTNDTVITNSINR